MYEDIAIFDIETDGLNPSKIWCLAVKDSKGKKSTYKYEHMRSFFTKAKVLVGHNIIRYDIPAVEKLLGVKTNALLVDTLALSWYLYPERNLHGLEAWGEEFGVPKPEINDWENLTLDKYIHRCQEDVKINTILWEKMWSYMMEIYGRDENKIWEFIKYLSEKMDCAREQENSRWKLDVERCKTELESLLSVQTETVAKLTSAMPKVKKYASKSRPAKPFKKDGTYSVTGARWFALVREHNPHLGQPDVESFTGEIEELVGEEEGNPASHIQVKDWLYSYGWKPETFKYKRDKQTGETKSIPQINLEHGAGICPSVSKLYDKQPNFELLEGLGVIAHRVGILNGFLRDVDSDGYLKASIAGLTNTLRFKHAEIVNLPKVGKPYGDIVRGVLIAPEGHELCGSDMSSLEDRLKKHYIFPYDPDYVREMSRDDYDPHLSLALLDGSVSAEAMQAYIDGTDKSIKPIRDIFKSVNYAGQYGAGAPRIALTGGIPLARAKQLHAVYWKKNWAIKSVAADQKVKTVDGQMWLLNPVNGFYYSLRFDKDRFSTLVQGTASYVFDMWVSYVREVRPQFTFQYHDELGLTIKKGNREKCIKLIRNAMDKLNDTVKLNVKLDCDIQFGPTYADIH